MELRERCLCGPRSGLVGHDRFRARLVSGPDLALDVGLELLSPFGPNRQSLFGLALVLGAQCFCLTGLPSSFTSSPEVDDVGGGGAIDGPSRFLGFGMRSGEFGSSRSADPLATGGDLRIDGFGGRRRGHWPYRSKDRLRLFLEPTVAQH